MSLPLAADEQARLQALYRYKILDTPAEKEFDDIALLASRICGTPIAMISLIDEKRQWFKSKVGTTVGETARDVAFCAQGILQAEVFVVPDAEKDARFAANPLVAGNPRVRFYAGAPLVAPDGHRLGMICVNDRVPRELTDEQKEALQALSRQVVAQMELKRGVAELQETVVRLKKTEQSLQLLNSAVEQAKESIIITDAELDLPGPRILFVNPAFTRLTGYSAEEVLGRTPRLLQGPGTDRETLDRLRRKLSDGEVFEGETTNYRKDGAPFQVEWQVTPIREAGREVTHYVSIQRDISERKRIEARLFQSQKMETVGKLAGGVAHEFNSILTAIIGQSEVLMHELPVDSPGGRSAQQIRLAADRAAVLTRQLLAYGRKQLLRPEILDLNRVLADMIGTLQHVMGRQVDVRLIPAPDLKRVRIDPGQIEQVILNLAINAAEAMPNGGLFTLETANAILDENFVRPHTGLRAGGYVMLAITDTGAGMSDEVKARAFEPFFSTKGVGEGPGLGLSTCYGIVKQSEGHLSVYSEIARGTTFKIYLPQVEQRATVSLPRPDSPALPRGTETILLAEDDPSLLEMASSLLRSLGYTVLTAVDGLEALGLKNRRDVGHIDLLFTDVVMPNMSGKELSERIQAIYPGTRILFTSAYTENAIVRQGMAREGVMMLQKPFTPSALAQKVREALDRPPARP